MIHRERLRVDVQGAVQGIGFRPFVYQLASELGLSGWVANTRQGAALEVEGPNAALDEFLRRLDRDKPRLARYTDVTTARSPAPVPSEDHAFEIRPSADAGVPSAFIMPDLATCDACIGELFDPRARRYRYPFTSCSQCGPRYSILERLPYDRPNTSMKAFALCAHCRSEYDDPRDRRFHAQPLACAECGPRLFARDSAGRLLAEGDQGLCAAVGVLRQGGIVAWKGVGGFLLSCLANDAAAVDRLRARKRRFEKPLAVMVSSESAAARLVELSKDEARLLGSVAAPIVLLRRRPGAALTASIAPGLCTVGIMLPSSPLHHLLAREVGTALVATSGNLSEEPLCTDEREAVARLGAIADLLLCHDRPIARPVDDSVAQVAAGRALMLRRARGFAPEPVKLSRPVPSMIAVGGHLKSTVAVARGTGAYLSPHIGDLDTPRALDVFRSTLAGLSDLYGGAQELVACDAHADYTSTEEARALADRLGARLLHVQHHHAHVLACAAEHRLEGPVLGVAWDGAGAGPDGTLWGGEFLRVEGASFERLAHLRAFSLPGGEQAAREPRRAALGLLFEILDEAAFEQIDLPPLRAFTAAERRALLGALRARVNTPRTSSAGRLFDGVAALLNVRQRCSFEGQAAMELEHLVGAADVAVGAYELARRGSVLDWEPVVRAVIADVRRGQAPARIAERFHEALAEAIAAAASEARLPNVVLAGGCFQNRILLERTVDKLRARRFEPHWPLDLPPNDGALALGQVVAAALQTR